MVRYRLQSYPSPQNYQTQVIDYPGGAVYSGQNVAYASNPNVNAHPGYQRYQPAQTVQHAANQNPIPSAEASTTTTQLPVTIQTQPIEEVSAPIPAIRAPIRRIVVSEWNLQSREKMGAMQS